MAGAVGIEPANAGTKNRCRTTWLRPIRAACARRRDSAPVDLSRQAFGPPLLYGPSADASRRPFGAPQHEESGGCDLPPSSRNHSWNGAGTISLVLRQAQDEENHLLRDLTLSLSKGEGAFTQTSHPGEPRSGVSKDPATPPGRRRRRSGRCRPRRRSCRIAPR